MFWYYVKSNCCTVALGLLLMGIAMVGELASPIFVGAVVAEINKKEWDKVN